MDALDGVAISTLKGKSFVKMCCKFPLLAILCVWNWIVIENDSYWKQPVTEWN